jgi:hypothetical protein
MTGSPPPDGRVSSPDESSDGSPEVAPATSAEAGLAVVYHLPFGSGAGQLASRADLGADSDHDTAGGTSGSVVAVKRAADSSVEAEPEGGDEREDWAWVREWRAGQEPTPWVTGVPLAVFAAVIVGVAVWVLSAGLADRPVVAVLVNLLVAGGLTPAMWLSRNLPVLRWIAAGAAAGIVIGWVGAILMLPLPAI